MACLRVWEMLALISAYALMNYENMKTLKAVKVLICAHFFAFF